MTWLLHIWFSLLPWWSLQVSIRQTLVLPRVYVVENTCELSTVLLSEHMNPHFCWRIWTRSWMFILRLHVFVNCCNCTFDSLISPWWSLQVSIRQTLVLPRVYVVENACELSTVLLSEHMNPHVCWRICVRSWTFRLRLHVFVNFCNCTFDSLILPWWSLQVSIRQTLVLPRVYVVENACELYTVLLSEHMNPHVCWSICVRSWTLSLRLHVFVNCCNCTFDSLIFAMMILTSFHSADPSTSTGVRCGKCLWVIHRSAIWAYELTFLLDNLCASLDVCLALACLCEWLQLHIWLSLLPWWSLQVSIRQTLVLPRVYVVENACELSTVLLSEHMNPHVCWRICVRSWMFILRLHVFVNCCNCTLASLILPSWSLQVSIRQTLVLPRVYVVENACELSTVLLSEHMNPHFCWRICVRSWMFILRLHVFVNLCNCTFDSVFLPWWSLQVSIRQTLVLPRVYVVENACELSTVLLSEHMNPHFCWRICVPSWTFRLRLHVFVNGCNCTFDSLIVAMMILTSFHSADPSTPTGVGCGKCLWVIHRPAIWAYESTCLLENLCAFLDVYLALACLCELLQLHIWLTDFCHDDPYKFPFGRP